MDPGQRGWPAGPGGGPGGQHPDQGQPQGHRQGGSSFGPNNQQHPNQQTPHNGQTGLPPSGATFPQFHQAPHSLANLAGISQQSPRQPTGPRQEGAPTSQQQGFSLPGVGQATGQQGALERDRERAREEHIHIKAEQDRREQELERARMEQLPQHQAQHGQPMQIHQPIAVGPRTAHGPNGILGNASMQGPHGQPQLPPGAPGGAANMFAGGPVQSAAQAQGPQLQPGLLAPFGPGAQGQPQQQVAQNQQAQGQGQGQGQQPILNDALSYLDQVKVQFADHPDVYNRFLDIMKDFKSGAIDTPGVIGRVSTLFAGNPDLIQGFNTFLPPGYRIECGSDGDPNAIRVTTPMGTTVQSMPPVRPLSRQEDGDNFRPNGTFTPQPGQAQGQMMFSPGGRPAPTSGQQQTGLSPAEAAVARQQEQQAMHQQEQRGVNSLQTAVSVAAGAQGIRAAMSPGPRGTPGPGQDANGVGADGQQAQGGMEKRGPVEFNHAISYVNKIKNRFSAHPDIYKQFLEILQTYQRESKPIQDVYGQVTRLFNGAPDLLEDFKQFLPESAAAAKAAAMQRQQAEANAMMSSAREEPMYHSPIISREPQVGTPSHKAHLPPVGNFAPTPLAKDNSKRKRPTGAANERNERQTTAGTVMDGVAGPSTGKQYTGSQHKRPKTGHPNAKTNDQPPASPTLVPAMPQPIPPTTTSTATSDELGFFDKAKKLIGNKNTMNEFLKLCNLFSQDLIDRTVLVQRARVYLGGNAELMKWFTDFVGYDDRDVIIENRARVLPGGRVSLSNCRGMGPSYRLLPKRERQKPCSGRDELCNSVLNDEWASHPTWASEDSGFIAHKKNVNEEGLHRIEEERHDYDFNIEACNRTIQLLEPIAQQLRRMSDTDQEMYRLPPGLGGQSETIYKRVIMKLYGRDRGQTVIERLEESPYLVIPVLLNRLKERLETWKMAQREWEKVWRDQTSKMFYKSLDHQSASFKNNLGKTFQQKALQSEIAVKYEDMKRQEPNQPGLLRKPQMIFDIQDQDVLLDATVLMVAYFDQNQSTEQPRLIGFVREFMPIFFGLDIAEFNVKIKGRLGETPTTGELIDDSASGTEDGVPKMRKKNGGLLRATLNKAKGRGVREDSNTPASRASTPGMDTVSNAAEDEVMADNPDEAENKNLSASARWIEPAAIGGADKDKKPLPHIKANESHSRDTYRMYANSAMYCFVRMIMVLYERLCKLKLAEPEAKETVKNAKKFKPASELGISDKGPDDFFEDTTESANYYRQMLRKFEDVARGEIEFSPDVEETLRRFYLQSGYPLYAFEKIMQALTKYAAFVCGSDNKDKAPELYQLFKRDRAKESTTAAQQTDYRKAVEKLIKDADLYRIEVNAPATFLNIRVQKKDDPTLASDLSPLDQENLWRYYIGSYTSVDPTEGVDHKNLRLMLLRRNLRAFGADPSSISYPPSPRSDDPITNERLMRRFDHQKGEESLVMRIAVGEYFRIFEPGTFECWFESMSERQGGKEGVEEAVEAAAQRKETATEAFELMNAGMKGLSKSDVEEANENFTKLVQEGVQALESVQAPEGKAAEEKGNAMEID